MEDCQNSSGRVVRGGVDTQRPADLDAMIGAIVNEWAPELVARNCCSRPATTRSASQPSGGFERIHAPKLTWLGGSPKAIPNSRQSGA